MFIIIVILCYTELIYVKLLLLNYAINYWLYIRSALRKRARLKLLTIMRTFQVYLDCLINLKRAHFCVHFETCLFSLTI